MKAEGKLYYSKWYSVPVCTICKNELSEYERMYYGGVCPYCGHDDNSTICDTFNRVQRNVYTKKWYFFGLIPIKTFLRIEYLGSELTIKE